jgi:hypothetical protein
MDCVLSYHMNPLTCGVAKFNLKLARELGVSMHQVLDPIVTTYRAPVLSMKMCEFDRADVGRLGELLDWVEWRECYSLFLHSWEDTEIEHRMVLEAVDVFCGNAELASQVSNLRQSNIHGLWCPGTLIDARRFDDAEISVFTFGMAHKIRSRYYDKLKNLLEDAGKSYCLYVSTALHENTSFDDDFSVGFEELSEVFDHDLRFLGYLLDDATYNYLLETDFFVAFFEQGVRANNTTVHAAMHCGAVVITNLDEYSPPEFQHMKNIIDITQCDEIPQDRDVLAEISANAIKLDEEAYGWSALVRNMRSEVGAPEELSADDNDRDTVKAAELASETPGEVPGGAGLG